MIVERVIVSLVQSVLELQLSAKLPPTPYKFKQLFTKDWA